MDQSARNSMLLSHMTGAEINEHVLKHYNYNGMDSEQDIYRIATAERAR